MKLQVMKIMRVFPNISKIILASHLIAILRFEKCCPHYSLLSLPILHSWNGTSYHSLPSPPPPLPQPFPCSSVTSSISCCQALTSSSASTPAGRATPRPDGETATRKRRDGDPVQFGVYKNKSLYLERFGAIDLFRLVSSSEIRKTLK